MEIESKLIECPDNTSPDYSVVKTPRLCPSVVDRYFTKKFEVNLPKGYKNFQETKSSNYNDICILRHSNKLCIITLAPSHPVISNIKLNPVTNISFKVSDRLDHSLNHVSGKRKRGAHWLNPTTPLCIISCSDGSKYTIYCGTRGSLVETNDRLVKNPSLLEETYLTEGYIAIVMPKLSESSVADELLSETDYREYCSSVNK